MPLSTAIAAFDCEPAYRPAMLSCVMVATATPMTGLPTLFRTTTGPMVHLPEGVKFAEAFSRNWILDGVEFGQSGLELPPERLRHAQRRSRLAREAAQADAAAIAAHDDYVVQRTIEVTKRATQHGRTSSL